MTWRIVPVALCAAMCRYRRKQAAYWSQAASEAWTGCDIADYSAHAARLRDAARWWDLRAREWAR